MLQLCSTFFRLLIIIRVHEPKGVYHAVKSSIWLWKTPTHSSIVDMAPTLHRHLPTFQLEMILNSQSRRDVNNNRVKRRDVVKDIANKM